MKVNRGDVVLFDAPVAGGSTKLRPGAVIQSDHNNDRLTNTIVAAITSNVSRASYEPTQVLLRLSTPEGLQSGLIKDSAITCENIFTIERRHIRRLVGRLPEAVMRRVDASLAASLGLTAPTTAR